MHFFFFKFEYALLQYTTFGLTYWDIIGVSKLAFVSLYCDG